MEFSLVKTGSDKIIAREFIKPEILFCLESFLDILRYASVKLNSCCCLDKRLDIK